MPTIQSTPTGAMLEGELTVHGIPGFVRAGYTVIDNAPQTVTMDLSRVTRVDSASVALLIDWLRYAKQAQKTLTFTHLPEKMQQMMRLSDLKF